MGCSRETKLRKMCHSTVCAAFREADFGASEYIRSLIILR